jgi:PAS domain S-box-containing protein
LHAHSEHEQLLLSTIRNKVNRKSCKGPSKCKEVSSGQEETSTSCKDTTASDPMKPAIEIWDTILDNEGKPIWTAPGMHKITGYTAEEILTIPDFLKMVIYKDDLPMVLRTLHEAIVKGTEGDNLEFRCNHKNGTIPWMSVSWKQAYDDFGNRIGVRASGVDITQKKLANENSRMACERYNIVTKAISDTIWEWDIVNDKMHYNAGIYKMFGYTETEVGGIAEWWKTRIHEEDIAMVSAKLQEVFDGVVNQVQMEYRFLCADNTYKFILDRAFLVLNEKGEKVRMIGVMQDVSDRKKNELELKNLLETTTNQNTRLRNFAYIVSHNIRSHSANISALFNFIEEANSRAEKVELNKMLRKSICKLEETISNLNDIVTIQNDTKKEKVKIFLHSETEKTKEAVNAMITKENAVIMNQVPVDVVIDAIPSYIESILLNMITNALKYRSEHRHPVIRIYTKTMPEGFIRVSFEDNGRGLDLNKVGDKIFGMYKTFHNNQDAKGFGLFICKNQVEAMGGRLEVESEVEKGTTFHIYLPYKKSVCEDFIM